MGKNVGYTDYTTAQSGSLFIKEKTPNSLKAFSHSMKARNLNFKGNF